MKKSGQSKETFESLLRAFEYRYDLRTVFDDFLTLTLCAFSRDPETGLSYDEDLYLQTIEKYNSEDIRHNFPKMVACLAQEMENQSTFSLGNDVLGTFYEQNLYRKGTSQYFTPWPVCYMIANCLVFPNKEPEEYRRLRILDPCCGSGRLLTAGASVHGKRHEYYGIDIDHTCVKMTALNLFLNGVFHGEVMWADSTQPDDFRISYKLSFLPFGIFRIVDKDKSRLWYLHASGFSETPSKTKDVSSEPWQSEKGRDAGTEHSQLNLF